MSLCWLTTPSVRLPIVLIGLEVLVAATIIKTLIIDPSVESLGYLAIIVTIRTILGWTTVLEISDRWPWQRERPHVQ